MSEGWNAKYSDNSVLLFIISYHSHIYFCPECFISFYHNEALHTVSVQCYTYVTAAFWETTDHVILHGSCEIAVVKDFQGFLEFFFLLG